MIETRLETRLYQSRVTNSIELLSASQYFDHLMLSVLPKLSLLALTTSLQDECYDESDYHNTGNPEWDLVVLHLMIVMLL